MGTEASCKLTGRDPGKPVANRDAGERGNDGAIAPLLFHKRGNRAEVPFHNSINRHFMVYEDRLETNLLQLGVHPKIQNGFL